MRDSAALGISAVDYPRDSRVKYTEEGRKGEVEGYRDLKHFEPRIRDWQLCFTCGIPLMGSTIG